MDRRSARPEAVQAGGDKTAADSGAAQEAAKLIFLGPRTYLAQARLALLTGDRTQEMIANWAVPRDTCFMVGGIQ